MTQPIKELDMVALVGAVVLVHEDGRGFEVELTADGETYAVVTVPAAATRLLRPPRKARFLPGDRVCLLRHQLVWGKDEPPMLAGVVGVIAAVHEVAMVQFPGSDPAGLGEAIDQDDLELI